MTNEQFEDMVYNHVEKIVAKMSHDDLVGFVTENLLDLYSTMSRAELLELIELDE